MNDCPNAEIRDLLPDLLHDQLDAALRAAVESHVAGCASCRDELTLLRSLHLTLRSERARVDVAAIVAALPTPPSARPDPKVVPIASRRRRLTDWRVAAAATLLIAGSASVAVLRERALPTDTVVAVQTAETATKPIVALSPESATKSVVSSVAPAPAGSSTQPAAVARVAENTTSRELAVTAGLSDLSDDQLRSLIGSLDDIEAVPDAEPDPNPVRLPSDPGATP